MIQIVKNRHAHRLVQLVFIKKTDSFGVYILNILGNKFIYILSIKILNSVLTFVRNEKF